MYSQNDEEKYIIEYFNSTKGKFLDIGAYNPFKFSNTRRLYEYGWSGICIEPSPICFNNFIKEYENEPRITLINKAVVTDNSTSITFYESGGDAVSTSELSHKQKWENSGARFSPIQVETIKVSDIELFENIDFMSLDVESSNFQIFSAFSDLFLSKLKMVCIEHDGNSFEIRERLEKMGFKIICLNPENIIMAK
jgi:FkbM family methyltransferase